MAGDRLGRQQQPGGCSAHEDEVNREYRPQLVRRPLGEKAGEERPRAEPAEVGEDGCEAGEPRPASGSQIEHVCGRRAGEDPG